ncbi:hypothetical protein CASFOL_025049 [Castilleja foliolosa]|uniref:Uncharacterized protein n=1 Tax=Castilleja foliolosa TaxID=1961234 RepID=A0ABD3CTQ6_9LAMI
MWELGNIWSEGCSTIALVSSSYLSVMHEINVLVVDHDSDNLINTATLLELCQYKVTLTELSSEALKILASGKIRVDLIMANINVSPDLDGFKLLQQASAMDIPVVLMSTDDNAFMAMKAIESGAYIYVKKPPAQEVLKCLWQYVVREKMKAAKERELMLAANINAGGININNMHAMDKPESTTDDHQWDPSRMMNGKVKRKVCTEWTQDLHDKFMHAVETLGEGRCFPKEILQLMNVSGLTRMQVASHLQKCRNDNWRSPEVRKSMSITHQNAFYAARRRPRRFGSMPRTASTAEEGNDMKTPQSEAQRLQIDQPDEPIVPGTMAVDHFFNFAGCMDL